MFVPVSSSMRFTQPRIELRKQDRRSGAYPTKARTGDRTRSGRNKIWFDDTRTVIFQSGVNVNLPTTFHVGLNHLVGDMTSSFAVVGNVDSWSVDQWIPHREQVESLGPFIENKLFEQDEHAVVNSSFMTGAAYAIASDRFKSGLSSKTIIRLEQPIVASTTLHPSASAMHYYNSKTNVFDRVIVESNVSAKTFFGGPWAFDRVLFTPYGFTHSPTNFDLVIEGSALADYFMAGGEAVPTRQTLLQKIVGYTPNGHELWDRGDLSIGYVSASLYNPSHIASANQTIKLTGSLSKPFLLEKAVLELDIEAGSGWMNDSFAIFFAGNGDLSPYQVTDMGGPAITFALLRQDKTSPFTRDLITSGAITNAFDIHTASFIWDTYSSNGFDLTTAVKSPLNSTGSVNQIIYGTSLSGSGNAFTGTVKLIMDPAVTQHVFRGRISGSLYLNSAYPLLNGDNEITYMTFSSNGCRPGKFETTRNILGNQLAMLDPDQLTAPVPTVMQGTGCYTTDVACITSKSPYLLYPEDELIVCINKYKNGRVAHDVKIKAGMMKLTLYGDLIKEDREYHDTLNQRLETVELWENIGEEPVLDQFDVVYRDEMSGSYLDRFSVLGALTYTHGLSASLSTTQYHSNFAESRDQDSWSTQHMWSRARRVHELKKSMRNMNLASNNELYWDTRLLFPSDIILQTTPNFKLGYWSAPNRVNFMASTDTGMISDGCINGWFMKYPFEPVFSTLAVTMDPLTGGLFNINEYVAGSSKVFVNYADVAFQFSDAWRSEAPLPTPNGHEGVTLSEFIKYFFGIGDGYGPKDNQFVQGLLLSDTSGDNSYAGAKLRGWRYGMLNGFTTKSSCVFRRDRFGQMRDMFEQRLDTKFYERASEDNTNAIVKTSAVEVRFYDRDGHTTDSLRTLSSNLSFEATSSMPYTDGIARNRPVYDNDLNILNITV